MNHLLSWLVFALVATFVLALILSGCAQPTAPVSRVAAANPWCIAYCWVAQTSVDDNKAAGAFSPTLGATSTTSTKSKTTTETETAP